jgi:hypothetical protein
MKSFIKIIIGSFLGLYAVCAWVSWDIAVMAHTTEGARLGYIFGGMFISTIILCAVEQFKEDNKK